MYSYKYRRIWEEAYGPIPKDEQGRSFEIHHLDGNRNNNSLENLVCLSIEDHYKLHLIQGDFHAANLIAKRFNSEYLKRFKKPHTEETIKKIKTTKAKNPYRHTEQAKAKLRESTKNRDYSYLKGRKLAKETIVKRELTREVNGNRKVLVCPHCKAEGINFMKRWHFDNCLTFTGKKQHTLSESQKKKMKGERPKRQCPHCGLEGGGSAMSRYHFDNCKHKN